LAPPFENRDSPTIDGANELSSSSQAISPGASGSYALATYGRQPAPANADGMNFRDTRDDLATSASPERVTAITAANRNTPAVLGTSDNSSPLTVGMCVAMARS